MTNQPTVPTLQEIELRAHAHALTLADVVAAADLERVTKWRLLTGRTKKSSVRQKTRARLEASLDRLVKASLPVPAAAALAEGQGAADG